MKWVWLDEFGWMKRMFSFFVYWNECDELVCAEEHEDHEYEYNDSSKTIHKEFIFQDNNWIYNTVSASTELRIHK